MSRQQRSAAAAVQRLLADAVAAHQAGRLDEAKQSYLQLLAIDARHAKSLYGLGLIALQTGNPEAAVRMLERAIAINGNEPGYHACLAAAFQSLRKGDAALAEYQRVLALRPKDENAHFNLGNILLDQREFGEARAHYEHALRLRPSFAEAHNNLGLLCLNEGKLMEARACYERALAQEPDFAEAHNNLGNLCWSEGNPKEARAHFERALQTDPDFAEAHNNLGNVLRDQGQMEEAARHYLRTIALRPDFAEAHNNLGIVYRSQERLEAARACCQRALALRPEFAEAYNNLGNILCDEGRPEEATACYENALRLRPDYAEAHNHLGVAWRDRGMLDEAEACHQQALALRPDYAEAHNNLAVVYRDRGRFDESQAGLQRALSLKPDYAEALVNLGHTMRSVGKLADARQSYEQALALKPDLVEAQWCLGLIDLLEGHLAAGWRNYETRHQRKKNRPRSFPRPIWRGTPLKGERILLHSEQGAGDTIQFLRYVPMVAAAGGAVLLDLPGSLLRLGACLPGVETLVACGDSLPSFDWHCPLMSLPLAFATTLETIPAHTPYLEVPEEALRRAESLSWPDEELRAGLVWSGNPRYPEDRMRSIPLALFEPLLSLDRVRFFSLQMGPAAAQMAGAGLDISDLKSFISDFADTAALISQLDLVIAVDTSVAHLAGALAKPTWILLPFAPDWRWLQDREDSPWYPTARLFRQPRCGDWQAVIERVRAQLTRWAQKEGAEGGCRD